MSGILDALDGGARELLSASEVPAWTDPMLATLVDEQFSDPDWIFERKLDGERCLAFRDGGEVRLLSRNRRDLVDTDPELLDPLGSSTTDRFVVDGEIVAFEGDVTSFERLQHRMQIEDPDEARDTGIAVSYYLFDVLHAGEWDTTALALRDRKTLLRDLFAYRDPLRFTPHRNEEGEAYYREACRKGWEGLIAKDATAPYVHSRSRKWLKFKCVNRQELVIGGFTDPEGERIRFGAILVGYYEDGDLVYAGKVGTGFDDETLHSLGDRMEALEQDDPPFDRGELPSAGVHWIAPELVGEIGFTEWTDHKLRHPRYLGLRRDKDPADVVREEGS
jgi:DNA ligase D-like protein (predicted ligase)